MAHKYSVKCIFLLIKQKKNVNIVHIIKNDVGCNQRIIFDRYK